LNLKLKDCTITAIDGGSIDVSPSCDTCWSGEEWVDYVEVSFGDNSETYDEITITQFLDWLFTVIETDELSNMTREQFDEKMEELGGS